MATEQQNKISNIDLAEEAKENNPNTLVATNGVPDLSEERKQEITEEMLKVS